MFRDFKSGGYNLEDINVSGNRLISLILIIAFAYSWTTFTGEKIKKKGVQKYVARVKEYGRVQRRHSSFYVGLYGQSWVSFMDDCWAIVQDLMRLNCNKLEYYLQREVKSSFSLAVLFTCHNNLDTLVGKLESQHPQCAPVFR